MSTPTHAVSRELRIDVDELRTHMESGESITVLDARNPKAWEPSADKICGAIRVDPAHWQVDPSWPRDQMTVVY